MLLLLLLKEECQQLQDSNRILKEEATKLREETACVEQKERELVAECLQQLGGCALYRVINKVTIVIS